MTRLLFQVLLPSLVLCATPGEAFQVVSRQIRHDLIASTKFGGPSPLAARRSTVSHSRLSASRTSGINGKSPLSHSDIVWKIRSHPGKSRTSKLYFRAAAWILHAYLRVTKRNIPSVLCPAGGLCQIEAWYHGKQVGRFGVTTTPGPSMPLIGQQLSQLYSKDRSINIPVLPTTAAIQYMVVEPDFRKRNVGVLALQVIAHVHAYINCDFTLLVADDNGSGKLIDWYQRHGYQPAPLLQDLLGSPNQKYGVAMVGPTNATLPYDCRLEWW